ncbi:MAG: hypothetical protein ACI9P9_000152 [Patescibacteria group bacterium]|jgi:uncharacterized protein YuzE
MEITFDKDADAMYIRFSNAEFKENKKADENTIIDIDQNDQIIGIEVLNVSTKIPKESLQSISVKNLLSE